MNWGLLGPEVLGSHRRTRALGLASVVRKFNDLAVPGMGGVWFGKQLLVANLGVGLAERARVGGHQFRNIEVANAVEALACWLALEGNGWQSDPRLFGRLKMQGKNDLSFRKVRQPGFYVTQPMRMRTVQPLLALGLVDAPSERFNAFSCTETGKHFTEAAFHNYRPKNRSVLQNLLCWMQNDEDCIRTYHSRQALSPIEPLTKEAREILRERIVRGSDSTGGRRSNLLDWMDELRKSPRQKITWSRQPLSIEDDHWRDIRVGALFFVTRAAAIEVLDSIEMHLGNNIEQRLSLCNGLPGPIESAIDALRECSRLFLKAEYDPSPGERAKTFCQECNQREMGAILKSLVIRDGRVLKLRGDTVVPGAAFRGVQAQRSEDVNDTDVVEEGSGLSTGLQWPEGISVRVQNLFLMNADLSGEINVWLNRHNSGRDSANG